MFYWHILGLPYIFGVHVKFYLLTKSSLTFLDFFFLGYILGYYGDGVSCKLAVLARDIESRKSIRNECHLEIIHMSYWNMKITLKANCCCFYVRCYQSILVILHAIRYLLWLKHLFLWVLSSIKTYMKNVMKVTYSCLMI